MVRGLFVPADGNKKVEERDYRTLEDYRAAVGGWIEAADVPSFGPVTMYVNENGIAEGLEPNLRATFLWWYHVPQIRDRSALVGDVALVGYPDADGNTTDVASDVLELLTTFVPHVVTVKLAGVRHRTRVTNRDYWEAVHWAMIKLSREPEIEDVDVVPAEKAERLPFTPIPPLPTLGN
ncbi:DUF3846 domain-containing protein [Protaetiibacter sp. SSC-01]|uniref:DUF3846 domain-containing protein n=1 Tax=Protaetiibacter sp. SSC-01 TaxID=2759943 RepID=UPI00165750F1|nr:DUF3846 domain-containing protein [Protaetiibacter sp. SSC-01]QNO38656.1 DUF3846 domain-containing protein [Protaetiibacter sp. SSC-01]